jgi:hypothetical protein
MRWKQTHTLEAIKKPLRKHSKHCDQDHPDFPGSIRSWFESNKSITIVHSSPAEEMEGVFCFIPSPESLTYSDFQFVLR